MAKNRIPTKKAEVSGAAIKHPERFRDRQEPTGTRPLGEPYPLMTDKQKECWKELADELPWLNSSHRMIVRVACFLTARIDSGDMGVQATQALSAVLSKLGATPVDSSKVNYSPSEDGPIDEFFTKARVSH